ncbi:MULTISPECIES: LysR family transcriptional regulator [unclassified Streptomyces]|uniref:LysR family transcriptional regulator n=1 Tax=unclassified Streptomyces TaxID=2593676 RepID=UPI00225B7661|nr:MULTISPECIES: LysR family transcriptional regulator [unclassified Streptomyces]MCX5336343.1 LysR family transcriptional regulator [Streptomyces sp. NBC_00140]MCX5367064.1 LysR family transcriptional regulator [Streptomyces sp. NBC_00124]
MSLDLNLLVPLNALLQERSVTAAAHRIGLSQPACSAALKRLRKHFGDELLVRVPGQGNQLTLLAERLRDQVSLLAAEVDGVFAANAGLRPDSLDREFSLLLSDAECSALATSLVRDVMDRDSGARLRLNLLTNEMRAGTVVEIDRHDAVIMPRAALPDGMPSLDLYEEEWVRIVSATRRSEDDDLDGARWAVCYDAPLMPWSPGQLLEREGLAGQIVVRVESFVELFPLVAGADLSALVPRRLAETWCESTGTRPARLPASLTQPFVIAMAWSPRWAYDPAHHWFRDRVAAAARR